MDFENTPSGGTDSYEKPNKGKYIGVLVGFAFIGTHSGGQYGPKPKVMLRWELHKRKGPSKDSQGHIHTVTQRFGATVKGENSLLKKCLEAHGILIPEGAKTSSGDWLGHAAWLDLELSDDGKYINVVGISKLDPDDDPMPDQVLPSEDWEPSSCEKPPAWARWAISRSQDLAHLVSPKAPTTSVVGADVNGSGDDTPF